MRNEAYTGAAVWGRTSKVEKAQEPVRVEGAWPALVSRELFDAVQEAMRDRAPKVQRPARVGSKFLLSGLLKCGVCGRLYRAQGAKSGQFAYYICGTLFREGAGTCSARYLNAPRLEAFVVEKVLDFVQSRACLISPPHLIWTVQGGMNSRGSGNDRVEMRRANSSFRRKAECRRWETRMPQVYETGSQVGFFGELPVCVPKTAANRAWLTAYSAPIPARIARPL